jgi:outer membrane protein OmpA-like peptidoglycan-associated protein
MRYLSLVYFAVLTLFTTLAQQDVLLTPACFNTKQDDFGVRQFAGDLYVLSAAINACDEIDMDEFAKKPFSDLYKVEGCELKTPMLVSAESGEAMNINTCFYDGPISSNKAGDLLFFTNNYGSDKNEKLTIYYTTKTKNGQWSKPLPFIYNNDKHNTTHPFYDEANNMLYFASDMAGGVGGMDIYRCTFQNGKFGQKEAVRGVNTAQNDVFPFVYKNTLYFSSQGHNSQGGYDLYSLTNLEVKTMGAVFNTAYDDLAIMFTDDKHGYFTSNRQTSGETDDVFAFELRDRFLDKSIEYVVKDKKTLLPLSGVKIRIIDDSTGLELLTSMTDDLGVLSQTRDSLMIESKHRYKVYLEKEGYVTKEVFFDYQVLDSNVVSVRDLVDIDLEPLSLEMEITSLLGLKSIYYDFDKSDLRADAIVELDKVVAFMNKYPKIEVELGSHTDCKGNMDYNQKLSDRRAKSAADYIQARISNPGRLTSKGYGESQLKAACPCEGRKAKSDCSDEQHQLNRRTEFIIKSLKISTRDSGLK